MTTQDIQKVLEEVEKNTESAETINEGDINLVEKLDTKGKVVHSHLVSTGAQYSEEDEVSEMLVELMLSYPQPEDVEGIELNDLITEVKESVLDLRKDTPVGGDTEEEEEEEELDEIVSDFIVDIISNNPPEELAMLSKAFLLAMRATRIFEYTCRAVEAGIIICWTTEPAK